MWIGGARKRRDRVEPAIVAAIKQAGGVVIHLNGAGVPDLLVLCRGRWHPLEVKSGTAKRTALQERYRCLIPVVTTPEEALRAIGAI